MNKIRIGRTITFNWHIDNVNVLEHDFIVDVHAPNKNKAVFKPEKEDEHTLNFKYTITDIGQYILSVYMDKGTQNETALDIKPFEGVRYSWNEDTDDNFDLHGELKGAVDNYWTISEVQNYVQDNTPHYTSDLLNNTYYIKLQDFAYIDSVAYVTVGFPQQEVMSELDYKDLPVKDVNKFYFTYED